MSIKNRFCLCIDLVTFQVVPNLKYINVDSFTVHIRERRDFFARDLARLDFLQNRPFLLRNHF